MSHTINTLFIGKVLHHFDRLDSTNNRALELIQNGVVAEGTSIVTDFQSLGKGQRGNTWQSDAGANLLVSIILKPSFLQAKQQFALNQMVSLSLIDLLSDFDIAQCRIKWPNDIYSADQKLAGILIQNILRQNIIEYSVVGIGLNVNQVFFSPSLRNPSSMSLCSSRNFDLNVVKKNLFEALEKRYLSLKNGLAKTEEDYKELMYAKDEIRSFINHKSNTKFTGIIRGTNEIGKLLIESNNEFKVFDFKEVSILPKS